MSKTSIRRYQESVTVQASAETLYDLVSDSTRTGEWSPVCTSCWWDDDAEAGQVGAWFTGQNELAHRTWETRSEVVAAERGHEFAWVVATSADRTTTTPGSTVDYTTTISNTGETAYAAATVTQDLSGVLPDARYNADATVTGGGVLSYADSQLRWTGALPVGASAVVTFTVTVDDPDTGDKVLITRVSSTDPGSSCPPNATDSACRSSVQVLVPALQVTKLADTTRAVAGQTVGYTVTVRNTGETAYAPATFTDDLTGVLDDATYVGDATATGGTVDYANSRLTWSGPLALGAAATISYSVTVALPATGNRVLANSVSSATAGASAVTGRRTAATPR